MEAWSWPSPRSSRLERACSSCHCRLSSRNKHGPFAFWGRLCCRPVRFASSAQSTSLSVRMPPSMPPPATWFLNLLLSSDSSTGQSFFSCLPILLLWLLLVLLLQLALRPLLHFVVICFCLSFILSRYHYHSHGSTMISVIIGRLLVFLVISGILILKAAPVHQKYSCHCRYHHCVCNCNCSIMTTSVEFAILAMMIVILLSVFALASRRAARWLRLRHRRKSTLTRGRRASKLRV